MSMHEMANKMMFELYLVSLKKQRCLVKRYWRLAQIPTLMLTNQNEVSGEELKPFPERLYVVLSRETIEEIIGTPRELPSF